MGSPLDKLQQAAEDGMEASLHLLHAVVGNDAEHRLTQEQAETARTLLRGAYEEIRKVGVVRAECDAAKEEIRKRARETKDRIRSILEGRQGSISVAVEEICPTCDGAGKILPPGELKAEDCTTCGGRGSIGPGGCDS